MSADETNQSVTKGMAVNPNGGSACKIPSIQQKGVSKGVMGDEKASLAG